MNNNALNLKSNSKLNLSSLARSPNLCGGGVKRLNSIFKTKRNNNNVPKFSRKLFSFLFISLLFIAILLPVMSMTASAAWAGPLNPDPSDPSSSNVPGESESSSGFDVGLVVLVVVVLVVVVFLLLRKRKIV